MEARRLVPALWLSLVAGPILAAEPSQPPPLTVIRAGVLIDGTTATPKVNQLIFIRGNRVESVGEAAAHKVPDG